MSIRKRMVFGEDLDSISMMEWELGSRTLNDLLRENEPVLTEVVLTNRIAQACIRLTSWYVGAFLTIKGEKEEVYECEKILPGARLLCKQIWPEENLPKPPKYEYFYVHESIINTAWKDGVIHNDQ